jgi:hypothetical protein
MTYTKFVVNALGRLVEEQRRGLLVMPLPRPRRTRRTRRAKCAKVLKFMPVGLLTRMGGDLSRPQV